MSVSLGLGVLMVAVATLAQEVDAPRGLDDPALQPRINAAIDRGVEHLLSRQHRDGSWTGQAFGSYRAGPTAFAAYALVESGVRPDSRPIRMALDYLERTPPTMVYSAGAILLLLAEIDDERYDDLALDCMDRLIAWESESIRGTWSYPSGPIDLSNMQFVALGFWGAHRLGLKVPQKVVTRLVEATIERFQEEPVPVDPAATKKSDPRMAGFHYFLELESRPVSASMTAAGIGIQRIAREIAGKKLGGRLLKAMDASEELGLQWIGAHWSVTENFGHHEGVDGQVLFYLWSLERLGAFYDSETIAGQRWYEPGARTIVEAQEDNGGWGRLHETDYALLFLGRATRASTTGGSAERERRDVWAVNTGPVSIHANGRPRFVAWITDLDCERPFHVEQVTWTVDGQVEAELAPADANAPWDGERFAFRWADGAVGEHTLVARVAVKLPDGTLDELVSDPLVFENKISLDDWFARATEGHGTSLLTGVELEATASSEAAGQYPARATDGYEGTAWIGGGEPNPRIDFVLPQAVRARAVTLSSPASSFEGRANVTGVERIRLFVNGEPTEHDLDPTYPGTFLLPLPKRTKVESLGVKILSPTEGRRGFAEIGLRD